MDLTCVKTSSCIRKRQSCIWMMMILVFTTWTTKQLPMRLKRRYHLKKQIRLKLSEFLFQRWVILTITQQNKSWKMKFMSLNDFEAISLFKLFQDQVKTREFSLKSPFKDWQKSLNTTNQFYFFLETQSLNSIRKCYLSSHSLKIRIYLLAPLELKENYHSIFET